MNVRVGVLALLLFAPLGCLQPEARLQSGEDPDREKDLALKTVGDVTTVGNAEPIAVSGVGLVVGLDGTGGGTPPGGYRTLLEDRLVKSGVHNPKEVLASPNNALVLVSGLIPAGARKGDPIDVEVTLPPQSKVTSLRGGVLKECSLYNYSSTHQINPADTRGDRPLIGHPIAKAEGPLLIGFGEGDETAKLKHGRIWGGGKSQIDRPFYLILNNDQQYVRVAMRVAERINETFQGTFHAPSNSLAEAKTKEVVFLRVPDQYRLNLPRFLRVVRLVPLQESPAVASPYCKRLGEDLLDPAHTVTAALRLEALGQDMVPVLKTARNNPHVLVRFSAAEALTYLGDPSGGEELATLADEQASLRAYCLTALASLDEAVCHVKLRDLLASRSTEARYGAFRALRALDEKDSNARGELLNDSFWLHEVAPGSTSLIHVSTTRRAEVVLFGDDVTLKPPFSFLAGQEFTVAASQDDERCTLGRFSTSHGRMRRQSDLKVSSVLRLLADMGGTYADAVELLRQANQIKCLSCPLAIDALPEATSVFDLAQAGATGPKTPGNDAEIFNARADFNETPTLFQSTGRRRATAAAPTEPDGGN
jgi:hypothetical protein